MKSQYIFSLLMFLFLITSCNEQGEIRHENLMDKHKYPSDYMYLQRSYPHGKIDKEDFRKGYAVAQKMAKQSSSRNGEWENVGPNLVGGRIVDIEGAGSTLYVSAASGGIFKTEDNGFTWESIFDDAITLSIGDMAISNLDNQVFYVGTGEANAGGGSLAYDGEGVYKTTDGGNNWQNIGLENVGSIGRVAIDPTDDNIVFVAAMGTLFSENIERGIFRTHDGGATWQKVLYQSPKTGGIDVVIDPQNPNIVYAALWERERLLFDRTYGGPTSGIYKSVDGGDNWVELTNGLPSDDMGRIGLAMAPSNPDVLYTTIARPGGNLEGIYKSTDGGNSWIEKSIDNITNVPFMWWFGRMKVDPVDENKVYHIGFRMNVSSDGGDTWENFFDDVHVDQHEVWIDPDNPDRIYVGNDGGVFHSNDGGEFYSRIHSMPITQFYRCEIDFMQPERIYGGTQDNGTIRTLDGSPDTWSRINGGDGFTPLVDPTDNNFVYATSQYGNLRRSENGGNNFSLATLGIDNTEPNNWNTPYVFDPNNPEIMYYGTNHLYRSTDRAMSWNKISEDLSNGPYEGINPFGTLTSISVSPFDSDQILVGTDDGNVWITNDLGMTWENISTDLPNRWVTSISHHPTIENQFFVTFSGYRYGENSAYAYMMNYPSEEWTSISDGLPQVPINDLIVIPMTNERIAALDVGVFISDEDGDWELLSDGLPNVIITDLDYHEPEDMLLVATYGRSMYTYNFDRSVGLEEVSQDISLTISPNPATTFLNVKMEDELRIDEIWISSIDGKKVGISIDGGQLKEQQIDISTLATGKYILTLSTEKGLVSRKFIVSA